MGGKFKKNRKEFQLIIFIVVALSSGWLGVLLDSILQEEPTGETPGMTVFLVLPLLTVVMLRWMSRDWNDFGIKPHFKGNLKWYLFSIVIFPVITFLIAGSAWVFDLAYFSNFEINVFTKLVVVSLLPGMIINIFEEFAWRGYLAPKLIELKINDWLIYIIVGLVWGLWHAAYYLALLPNMYFETISRVEYILVGCMIMVCWSVMFIELYRLTRSVWPGVVMHAIQDAFPNLLINNINDGGKMIFTKMADPWLNPTYGIITTMLFLGIGIYLRTLRIKKNAMGMEV